MAKFRPSGRTSYVTHMRQSLKIIQTPKPPKGSKKSSLVSDVAQSQSSGATWPPAAMADSSIATAAQIISISTAFSAAGGIATLSAFDIAEFQSQPASRALPMTRWLFSRGSHIFPQAALISSAGFAYLAYHALPAGPIGESLRTAFYRTKLPAFLAASLLTFAIRPFTLLFMAHPNFLLIEKNEKLGGSRSAASAKQADGRPNPGNYVDSIYGTGEANEFTDLSGPQEKTSQDSSKSQDEEVRKLLREFSWKNNVRAVLMAAGGFVGLSAALAA